MVRKLRSIFLIACVVSSLSSSGRCLAAFMQFTMGGDTNQDSIRPTVLTFRNMLGDPNNLNNPGPLGSGRREINWDGGGPATTVSPTPFNFFQNIRGALFTTTTSNPTTAFVQAPPSGLATLFNNPTYSTIFSTFSPPRLFTPIGSNITDVTFFVPGSAGAIPATVSAFGAVFTNVNLASTSRLQFFDQNNALLLTADVEKGTVSSGSLSFLGEVATAGEEISRVRITTGNAALGPNDNPIGGVNVVALDDFIYSEPRAVPEPSALILSGTAALVGLGCAWRRRRGAV